MGQSWPLGGWLIANLQIFGDRHKDKGMKECFLGLGFLEAGPEMGIYVHKRFLEDSSQKKLTRK